MRQSILVCSIEKFKKNVTQFKLKSREYLVENISKFIKFFWKNIFIKENLIILKAFLFTQKSIWRN